MGTPAETAAVGTPTCIHIWSSDPNQTARWNLLLPALCHQLNQRSQAQGITCLENLHLIDLDHPLNVSMQRRLREADGPATLRLGVTQAGDDGLPSSLLAVTSREQKPTLPDLDLDDVISEPISETSLRTRWWAHLLRQRNDRALLQQLIHQLDGDLGLAMQTQKSIKPTRYPELKKVQVQSRYLCGLQGGADYFDVLQDSNGHRTSVVLAHASHYRLSAAFAGQFREPADWTDLVPEVHEMMGRADVTGSLDLFYAVLECQNGSYAFQWMSFGDHYLFVKPPQESWQHAADTHPALAITPQTSQEPILSPTLQRLNLKPGSRIVLLSAGVLGVRGGQLSIHAWLTNYADASGLDLLNELGYLIWSALPPGESLPARDCTALVLDLFDAPGTIPIDRASRFDLED